MDKQSNSWQGEMASNQGEVSNMSPKLKSNTQLPGVENAIGAESGITRLIDGSEHTVPYSGNDLGINGTYENTNRSSKFKNPTVSQNIPEAGRNQYQ
jgi:hypothetical protein